jgi:hypothetical protein
MRITPTQTSFAPQGPPPGFKIETGGAAYYAVQITSEPVLFNAALANRRIPGNFFDSWYGDGPGPVYTSRPAQRQILGGPLEAPTGQTTYTLDPIAWQRLRGASQLYYRLLVFADTRRRNMQTTFDDLDWQQAPSISLASLPAQPARAPAAAFRGRSVLNKPNFASLASTQVRAQGMIQGRDGDFRYAILDAQNYQLTVVECFRHGLTDTISLMPRKPDAVINGQFSSGAIGIDTEGQVIREGTLIHSNTQSKRYYIAQTWRGLDIDDIHIDEGNPSAKEPQARVAFGGLGPVLLDGAPVTSLTPWAQSVYNFPPKTGRGIIALHRDNSMILLLVQENSLFIPNNAMSMKSLRSWLQSQGFDDAVFNDGSDSEALFAGGSWLLMPGWVKDEVMDFAISFVDRRRNRRARMLAIDGTRTTDAQAFIRGAGRAPMTHYAPQDISQQLKDLPSLASIRPTFRDDVLQAWRATTQAQADQIGQIIEKAGSSGHWSDVLYLSSHAWRHGQLWYFVNDDHSKPKRMIADIWSSGFRPIWQTTPSWLIVAGCAVLAMRYSRGLYLDSIERGHLVDWHKDIHGSSATVPELTAVKKTLFSVYHPGWAWYQRAFQRSPGLRGVLGYWYRSPSGGRDVEIVDAFVENLHSGQSFLVAWEAANRGGIFQAEALWAAMVRKGCEGDNLATLEIPSLPPGQGDFRYYDRYQRGRDMVSAYQTANKLDSTVRIGGVTLRINNNYDPLAIDELQGLKTTLTTTNFLEYSDGVGPP